MYVTWTTKMSFKPYIPADKIVPEFTVTSVLIGIILAVVFGAANAYIGLLVGMTISASIPAAVISMGIIRVILRRDSILENNLVQTIGSAGESLAAGAIFTLPALFLWAEEGKIDYPSVITIFFIALFGGLLGVCFMVPLRQALIVEEHGTLPFPGRNCPVQKFFLQVRKAAARLVLYSQDLELLHFTNLLQTVSNSSRVRSDMLLRAMQDPRSVSRYSPSLAGVGIYLRTEDLQLYAGRRYIKLVRSDAGDRTVRRRRNNLPGRSIDQRDAHNGGRRSVPSVV